MTIDKNLEKEIHKTGSEIIKQSKTGFPNLFDKSFWNNKLMEICMNNASLKKQVFHFVDVLPVLKTEEQVIQQLEEYFSDESLGEFVQFFVPGALKGIAKNKASKELLAKTIKSNAEEMARSFIAAKDFEELSPVLDSMRKGKLCFTIDLLGEATLSEQEALKKQSDYLILIDKLAKHSADWPTNQFMDFNSEELIPKINISIKLSSLYSQIKAENFDEVVSVLKDKLRPILRAARQNNCFINIDMESYQLKEITLATFTSILEEEEFQKFRDAGIVIQAYLRSAEEDLKRLINWCKEQQRQITVRLVKGAYWDYEVMHAQQNDWPIPVYTNKAESDMCFERLTDLLLENTEHTKPAFGTHNVRSIAQAIVKTKQLNISEKEIEFQMLYGMGNSTKTALINLGYRVREYSPIGELIPGMAYLVRRLLENTSNESFLRARSIGNLPANKLLESPEKIFEDIQKRKKKENSKKDKESIHGTKETKFINVSPIDFAIQENRSAYQNALKNNLQNLGNKIPIVINGEKIFDEVETFESINPCNPSQVIAISTKANTEHCKQALDVAFSAKNDWARTPIKQRAEVLLKASKLLQGKRFYLCAWETLEVAKPWKEADADIIEAADFCEYYAEQAIKLFEGKELRKVPGEDNHYLYKPKGVGVVIAPWNFPVAIPMGMIAAALVTGNPVIFKPSEQSVHLGYLLYKTLIEAGCPKEVLHFLPGKGSEIGPSLVESNKTNFISFTGSKEVGLKILQGAMDSSEEAKTIKKVVAEMGGKNALIIDSTADLDEAVSGAVYSAFGFQGQKCSALSRLIIHRDVYDEFIHRFKEAMKSIKVNDAIDSSAYLSALIERNAYEQTQRIIEETKSIAKETTQTILPDGLSKEGYFIPPTLFEEVPSDAKVLVKELFAPVVVALKADDINHAVEIANSAPFALTGGIFSRSPKNIDYVKENMEAGNIYINRSITGAIVSRHPFGGYKLSGVGSKAGGPDYLLQFVNPVTIVKNTIRRGFSPDIEN